MHDRQDELDKLLQMDVHLDHLNETLDKIEAIVREQCENPDGYIFSGFISVFADAMRILVESGRIRVTNDNGGRIVEGFRPCPTCNGVGAPWNNSASLPCSVCGGSGRAVRC